MKGLIITSWVLIGIAGLGVLMNIADNLMTSDDVLGLAIFGFYAIFTYKAQQLTK